MVRDTAATTMMAPSCAPLTESAVGLQLCCGLDSSAYLRVLGEIMGEFRRRTQQSNVCGFAYQHMKTE